MQKQGSELLKCDTIEYGPTGDVFITRVPRAFATYGGRTLIRVNGVNPDGVLVEMDIEPSFPVTVVDYDAFMAELNYWAELPV